MVMRLPLALVFLSGSLLFVGTAQAQSDFLFYSVTQFQLTGEPGLGEQRENTVVELMKALFENAPNKYQYLLADALNSKIDFFFTHQKHLTKDKGFHKRFLERSGYTDPGVYSSILGGSGGGSYYQVRIVWDKYFTVENKKGRYIARLISPRAGWDLLRDLAAEVYGRVDLWMDKGAEVHAATLADINSEWRRLYKVSEEATYSAGIQFLYRILKNPGQLESFTQRDTEVDLIFDSILEFQLRLDQLQSGVDCRKLFN